jgi:signal peptidase II
VILVALPVLAPCTNPDHTTFSIPPMDLPLFGAGAFVALVADRALKHVAMRRLAPDAPGFVWRGVRLRLHFNRAASLAHAAPISLAVQWLLLASALLWLLSTWPAGSDSGAALGAGLLLGGAASNAGDVWRHGAILDVVDLGWWPVFNLADAAIVSGAALLMLSGVAR